MILFKAIDGSAFTTTESGNKICMNMITENLFGFGKVGLPICKTASVHKQENYFPAQLGKFPFRFLRKYKKKYDVLMLNLWLTVC